MRCRLILLISEHPIQQGIRKGGGPDFWLRTDGRGRTDEDRMAYSRQLDVDCRPGQNYLPQHDNFNCRECQDLVFHVFPPS